MAEIPLGQSALVAIFLSLWFLFANCESPINNKKLHI